MTTVTYSAFFKLCGKYAVEYPTIWTLPVLSDPSHCLRAMVQREYHGGRVLDFGCGTSKPLQKILGLGEDRYHTCDNDPEGAFTFRSPGDIGAQDKYEVVAANQVFEHLTFEQGVETVILLGRHIADGGVMEIGVPNPQHPTRQLSNPTHITPWNYLNLCALLDLAGTTPILCARSNKVLGVSWWKRPLVMLIAKTFRMDWCDTVYAVGRRSGRTI